MSASAGVPNTRGMLRAFVVNVVMWSPFALPLRRDRLPHEHDSGRTAGERVSPVIRCRSCGARQRATRSGWFTVCRYGTRDVVAWRQVTKRNEAGRWSRVNET